VRLTLSDRFEYGESSPGIRIEDLPRATTQQIKKVENETDRSSCPSISPSENYFCTNSRYHNTPHIALGMHHVIAVWD
jgi:hypothetical protein